MPEGTPWSWRFGAKESGSGALGDIGSHALDLRASPRRRGRHRRAARPRPSCARGRGAAPRISPPPRKAAPTSSRGRGRTRWCRSTSTTCTVALMRFKNGALGTLEASRFAWGHKNYLTFELSGSKGALAFRWERRNELHYYAAADRTDVQGYRTIMCGPAQPSGELFWPIPGLGTAFYEAQVLQTGTSSARSPRTASPTPISPMASASRKSWRPCLPPRKSGTGCRFRRPGKQMIGRRQTCPVRFRSEARPSPSVPMRRTRSRSTRCSSDCRRSAMTASSSSARGPMAIPTSTRPRRTGRSSKPSSTISISRSRTTAPISGASRSAPAMRM